MMLNKSLRRWLAGLSMMVACAMPFHASALEPVEQNHRTYLINGLGSVVPFIGYGFANLKQKLGEAKHYFYATPVEGRLAIQTSVLAEIKREYRRDPTVQINLVGISYGGNIVTGLAQQLNREGIPVNYLGVLDGPILAAIPPNVHRVDNFVCRIPGCMGARIRLTKGNDTTIKTEFTYLTTHVGLGNHRKVHERVLGQLTAFPMMVAGRPIDTVTTGAIDRTMTGSIE